MTSQHLSFRKKLSRFLNWFGIGSGVVLTAAAFLSSFAGLEAYADRAGPGEVAEKMALQEKVTRLLKDYKATQSLHLLFQNQKTAADMGVVIDLGGVAEKDRRLSEAFQAEAQATGIALTHARDISAHDCNDLYSQLNDIPQEPAYIKGPATGMQACFAFSYAQSQVMDRPGFTPGVDSAQEIMSRAEKVGPLVVDAADITSVLLGIAAAFGFVAARKRLGQSIVRDEAVEKSAEARRLAAEADRKAAETAERERLAAQPVAVATALESDISVRQIKLAAREQPRAG